MLKPRPKVNVPAELLRLGYTLLCKNVSSDRAEHFEARHHQSGERLEIQVARTDVADPELVAERMLMQWNVGRGLTHPHLITIVEGGTFSDGRAWLATELVAGRNLAEVLAVEAPLAPARVLRLAYQIISALGVLHGRGAIHRELRPDSMRVHVHYGADTLKIIDLGVVAIANEEYERSREPSERRPMRPMGYLAPEIARGLTPDHRADIFAFGGILFHALTGQAPFGADDPLEDGADRPPPDLGDRVHDVPYQVLDVIQRCLESDPAARPQSARDVLRELSQAQNSLDSEYSISSALGACPMPDLPPPSDIPEWLRLSQRLELNVLSMGDLLSDSIANALAGIDESRTVLANRGEAAARAREAADTAARHRIEGRHRLQRRARRMQAALSRYREKVREAQDEVVAARKELATLEDRYDDALEALRQATGPSAYETSMIAWGTRQMTVDDVLEARTVLYAALEAARRRQAACADSLTALCAEEADLQRAFTDQELEEQDEGFRLEQRATVAADAHLAAQRNFQRTVLALLTHYVELSLNAREVA